MCTGTNPSIPVLHSWSGGSTLASHAGDPGSLPRNGGLFFLAFCLNSLFIWLGTNPLLTVLHSWSSGLALSC